MDNPTEEMIKQYVEVQEKTAKRKTLESKAVQQLREKEEQLAIEKMKELIRLREHHEEELSDLNDQIDQMEAGEYRIDKTGIGEKYWNVVIKRKK